MVLATEQAIGALSWSFAPKGFFGVWEGWGTPTGAFLPGDLIWRRKVRVRVPLTAAFAAEDLRSSASAELAVHCGWS